MKNIKEKNGRWKGDNVSYNGLHMWVKRNLARPNWCPRCKEDKKLQITNISGEYKRDLADWRYLCGKCHTKFDKEHNRSRRGTNHTGIARENKERLLDRARRRNKIHYYSYATQSSICNYIVENKYSTRVTENIKDVTCKHCLYLLKSFSKTT